MKDGLAAVEPTKGAAAPQPLSYRLRVAPFTGALLVGIWLPVSALTLGALFDFRQLSLQDSWWSLFGELGNWLPLGLLLCGALGVALGRPLLGELLVVPRAHRTRWWLVALCGYVLLLVSTPALLRHDGRGHVAWPAFVWLGALTAWLGASTHALVPLSAVWRVLQGRKARGATALAIALFAFTLGHLGKAHWDALAPITLGLSALVLELWGESPWMTTGRILGVHGFSVHIAPGCSGVEGLGIMTAFLAGFITLFRDELRVGRALAFLPVALALSFSMNAVRIALLMVVGAHYSETVALSGFHSKSGWLFFTLIALASVAALRHLPLFARKERVIRARNGGRPLEPYLLPLVVLTITGLVTGLFASDLDRWYGLRVLTGGACLWLLRKEADLGPSLSWAQAGGSVLVGLLLLPAWLALSPREPALAADVAYAWSSLSVGERMLGLGLRISGAALVVPWAEELVFRAYLLRRMASPRFEAVPYSSIGLLPLVASSAAFGLAHGAYWVPATLAGVAYAGVARRSGARGAIVAHAATNLALAAFVLAERAFDLW